MEDLQKLYTKLKELSMKQKNIIKKGDYDQLLHVLEEKAEIMDKIEEIDLKSYLKRQKDPQQSLVAIKDLLQETKDLEDENIEKLKERSLDVKKKLKALNLAEKSLNGYNVKKQEAKFIDKHS